MKAFALKHIIISLIILFIAYPFTTFAGEITGSFQNRWKPYANISINGNTVYTVITTGDGYVRIKEKLTNNYLNIEYGSLKSTGIQNGWYSAQWKLIATDSGFYKIQNRWKPDSYIHIEYGNLQSSTIQSGWYSAQWKFTQEVTSSYSLAVTKAGTGYGSVSSNPSGINCGTTCSTKFNANTNITLTATPDSSSIFSGWSGACSGTGSCIVYMNSAKNVTATFTKQTKKKAILLLHGLNSDPNTWKSFASYNLYGSIGKCSVIYKGTNQGYLLTYDNISYNDPSLLNCYATKFGAYDSLVSFNGGKCPNGAGCKGDYSTYANLGREVEDSIKYILSQLGTNTEIILLGHSRGGLAARAYLQGNYINKSKVVGLITTGTPHAGSRLARIYQRLKSCYPYFSSTDCKTDLKAYNFIKDKGSLDLSKPGIDVLSDLSSEIKNLNNNSNSLPKTVKYSEITYNGQWLGDLKKIVTNPYNALPSVNSQNLPDLYDFSVQAENCILYTNCIKPSNAISWKEAEKLQGDGIVDFNSQHLSKRGVSGLDIYTYPIYWSGTVHIDETNRVDDLNTAIHEMRSRLGWW